MNEIVVDSCVLAKWLFLEPDSHKADALIAEATVDGTSLILLDIAPAERTNVIWKRQRRRDITGTEARAALARLKSLPAEFVVCTSLLAEGLEIAMQYDRSAYDALFVALMHVRRCRGVTADEPLYNATHRDYPGLVLLKNL
ncbi:MAG TPA: type II toxin-antitoxin system VapC family toxin [Phycisphaerae bacterium]|nr:type II toxin-antitoxin system VapC family toxin [Phycisphaerae bacterium]